MWHAGGKLAAGLSLPRLAARWSDPSPVDENRRTDSLSSGERQAVWDDARRAASAATEEIRRLATTDPAGAADAARAAADLLHVAARLAEPGGTGPLTQAARAYDRASRDLYGRTPPAGPGGAGFDLRLAALALALVRRAAPTEAASVAALVVALAGLVDEAFKLAGATLFPVCGAFGVAAAHYGSHHRARHA